MPWLTPWWEKNIPCDVWLDAGTYFISLLLTVQNITWMFTWNEKNSEPKNSQGALDGDCVVIIDPGLCEYQYDIYEQLQDLQCQLSIMLEGLAKSVCSSRLQRSQCKVLYSLSYLINPICSHSSCNRTHCATTLHLGHLQHPQTSRLKNTAGTLQGACISKLYKSTRCYQ